MHYKIKDVTPPPSEKLVHDDAIHLFPLDMYQDATLNITGNDDMDKLASPSNSHQPSPPANVSTATHMREETNDTSDNNTLNLPSDLNANTKLPSPSVKPLEHTQPCPTNLPSADGTHHGPSTSLPPPQGLDHNIETKSEGVPLHHRGVLPLRHRKPSS